MVGVKMEGKWWSETDENEIISNIYENQISVKR